MYHKSQNSCLLILASLFFIGCAAETSPEVDNLSPSPSKYFPNQINGIALHLQLAIHPHEKSKGLMDRAQLATNHGLCFISDRPEAQSFWMRNTRIPLDLAHFDAKGTLLEVHALYPYDETPVKSHYSQIKYSIEMNQGWFARNQLGHGAKLNLNLISKAIKSRSSH